MSIMSEIFLVTMLLIDVRTSCTVPLVLLNDFRIEIKLPRC